MKKCTYLLVALMSMSLVACNGGQENNDTQSIEATNVIDALDKLTKLDNYSLEIKDTVLGDEGTFSFTEDAFYNSIYEYGYVESIDGVYQVSFAEKEDGLPSELITKEDGEIATKIYEDQVVSSFKDFDAYLLDEAETSVSITNSSLRLKFLEIVDEDINLLTKVKQFEAKLDGNTIDDLSFEMTFKDETYIQVDVNNCNYTSITELTSYVDNGGTYFQPDEDWVRIRNLFNQDNYTRYLYQYDDSNNLELIGKEFYDPNYFVTWYDCEINPLYAMYLDGYFGANNDILTVNYTNGKTEQGKLKGIYKTLVNYDTENKEYVIQPIVSRPYVDTMTDVSEALNYPKNLSTFLNYQYYEYDEESQEYYSDNLALALSMYLNFNLANLYQDYNVELIGTSFYYDMVEEDKDCVVTFKIYLTLNGQFVYQDFEFSDFGATEFKPLKDLTTTWTYDAGHPLGS